MSMIWSGLDSIVSDVVLSFVGNMGAIGDCTASGLVGCQLSTDIMDMLGCYLGGLVDGDSGGVGVRRLHAGTVGRDW